MNYLDNRPDALLVDEINDPEEVRFDVEPKGSRDRLLKTLLLLLDHPLRVWIRALGTRRGTGLLRRSTGYPVVSAMPSEDVSGELDGFLEIVPRINPI